MPQTIKNEKGAARKAAHKVRKTSRSSEVVVDLDASLKKIVSERARKSGLSASEFVMSAVQSYFAASLAKDPVGKEAKPQ